MPRSIRRTLIALLTMLVATVLPVPSRAGAYGKLIHKQNSLYHRIFVFRRGDVVTLRFTKRLRKTVQSQVDLSDLDRHMLEYSTLAFSGLLYHPEPERILVVGLGGGTIPRRMRNTFSDAAIDIVEIDPEILAVAERFFAFKRDPAMNVHIADGRVFIRRLLREDPVPRYDLVILDAFTSDYIPFHLMTEEFLKEVSGLLADDGVVVANVFRTNRLFDAELATFRAVFGRCDVYPGKTSTNAILISTGPDGATLTSDEAVKRAGDLQQEHRFSFDLPNVARRVQVGPAPPPRTRVLTDDRAPVNRLRELDRDADD